MKRALSLLLVALLAVSLSFTRGETALMESRVAALPAADMTDQIVLVEYTGGTDATVSRHQRIDGRWVELDSTYGYVGRTGMGKVKAGDNKTPLGTFNLTTPFGILDDPGAALPYLKVTKYHYWCSTSNSKYYNQLVDSRETGRKGRKPDEILINYKGYYNYCMFIDYNAEGVPGRGACIFLHCIGDRDWTHGCVAVPEDYMREVVCWAEAGAKIVILDEPLELEIPAPEAPATVSPAASEWEGCIESTGAANVRSGPGLDHDVRFVLSEHALAEYLGGYAVDERGTVWYRIRYEDRIGWVSGQDAALLME